MNPLRVEDPKTWERLQEIYNQITTNKVGPSLAAYRAYLLATSKSGGKDADGKPSLTVTHSICEDKLPSSITLVHTPGYAALQSLWLDGYEYSINQRQTQEYAELPKVLSNNIPTLQSLYTQHSVRFTAPINVNSGDKVLQDYQWRQMITPKDVKCGSAKDERGAILLSVYKQLRTLYDKHLNWVYWLLSKLVKITLRTPENELKIQFLPFVMTNPNNQTAVQMMEYVIDAARKTVLTHYIQVEGLYAKAVAELRKP